MAARAAAETKAAAVAAVRVMEAVEARRAESLAVEATAAA